MLELKNVSFRYAKNMPLVLDNISLTFDKGEFVAITGRNGSGKTTITRLLTGLEKPSSGRVLYNGADVTKEEASDRSRFIGYVFQQPDRQMFMPTVREEIAFGPFHQGKRGEELENAIDRAMDDTDTKSLENEYPRTLSRGDQQRVAIASALAMDTEYLVLDEPTSGLDPLMQAVFLDLVREEKANGTTVFMSSHILSEVADVCSRVVFIAHGKVVRDVTSQQLEEESGKRVRVVASGVLTPPKNARYIDSGKRGKYHELAFVHHGSGPELQAWVAGVKGLVDFYVADHSLEDAITELYGKETTV